HEGKTMTFEIRSTRALGPVTLEALDHHRRAYASVTHAVGTAWIPFTVPSARPGKQGKNEEKSEDDPIDGLRVRAGGALLELHRPHQPLREEGPAPVSGTFGGTPPETKPWEAPPDPPQP